MNRNKNTFFLMLSKVSEWLFNVEVNKYRWENKKVAPRLGKPEITDNKEEMY